MIEVAICTYNRAEALNRCLTVLSSQTAPRDAWGLLVIDNASTDATADIVERHRSEGALPTLRYVYEARTGLTAARQRAVGETEAPYLAFVDDDCHLAPDWIQEAAAAFIRHPGIAAVGGRVTPVWRKDAPAALRSQGWLFAEQPHGKPDKEGTVETLVGAGLVIDRDALIATGWQSAPYLDDRIGRGATSGGDVEISLRLRSAGGRLLYVPAMRLDHMIDPERQTLKLMIELSTGLGAGSAFVSMLESSEPPHIFLSAAIQESRARRWGLFWGLLNRTYGVTAWRIYHAFQRGRLLGLDRLKCDQKLAERLAGTCQPNAASGLTIGVL